ncbi:MAG: DUF2493 domain-containing protein [Thermoplasmata archaeon]|nr:DUF2493 domain-containing protein [Thermoplasmata archaeon]
MKIIIAGSRQITDYDLLLAAISESGFEIDQVISGAAQGVDALGERYAAENGITLVSKPAQWHAFGPRAGFIRNVEMANCADGLIALWDGKSSGTRHMVKTAYGKNLAVYIKLIGEGDD